MYEVLNKYLFQHKSISIPGLGSLVLETIPAVSDFANRQLLPVQLKFRLNKYADEPDSSFFSYIAGKKNITDFEAIRQYTEFAAGLCQQLKSGAEVAWKTVGVFTREASGEIAFTPYDPLYELFPAVHASRVVRANAKHAVLVGDKEKTNLEMTGYLQQETQVEKAPWWLVALILGAIGASILFFHFYRHQFKWGVTGNQQPVNAAGPR